MQELAPSASIGLLGGAAVAAALLALWNEVEAKEAKGYPGADASAEEKASWRQEIVGRYENRLREFSTPEKVFQVRKDVASSCAPNLCPCSTLPPSPRMASAS